MTMPPPDGDYSWAAICATIRAVIAGLFSWLVQRNKSGTDIEVAVLALWEKLNGALSQRLNDLGKEFADYRSKMAREIEEIHTKHNHEIDEMRRQHRAEMREFRDQSDELRRHCLQS